MSTEHDHVECDHQVKYCKKCDVCYCVKCGTEWGRSTVTWYPYYTTCTGYKWDSSETGSRSSHDH